MEQLLYIELFNFSLRIKSTPIIVKMYYSLNLLFFCIAQGVMASHGGPGYLMMLIDFLVIFMAV